MKLLVADDDAVSRLLMQRMLRASDFDVVTAKNGVEAIGMLAEDDGPRMVLLDWTMPEMTGLEVCRTIRRGLRSAYIYIALLTSKDSKEDLVAGLEAGADDYLTKPCHPEELFARLRTGQRILQLEDILVEANEKLRRHATRDALTQILNRGAIFEGLSAQLGQVRMLGAEFAVLLCDIDFFKQVNDTYGHMVGDEVLREIAARLRSNVRKGAVGRYGGEEFLLLLEGCGVAHVGMVADRICSVIRSSPVMTSVGPLNITISAGALAIDHSMVDITPELIVQQADGLLYTAKRGGRDRAVVPLVATEPNADLALHSGIG